MANTEVGRIYNECKRSKDSYFKQQNSTRNRVQGSTRIKAVLVDDKYNPIASGSYEWENRYENGVWTYSLDDIHKGLQGSYSDLVKDVQEKYGVELTSVGALGISAMMHGYMPFDKEGNLLVPFRTWRNNITGEASEKLNGALPVQYPSEMEYCTSVSGNPEW